MKKGKWYHTSWGRVGIDISIENLRLHIKAIESLLKKESDRLSKQMDKNIERLPPEDRDHVYEYYGDDLWRMNEVFPSIHRESMLITIFSILENQLNFICKELAPRAKCDIGLAELGARGIDRCKVYLKRVVGVSFPSGSKYWRDIKMFQNLRNIIVHNNSRLDNNGKGHKAIKDYIRKSKYLGLDDRNTIQIKEGFLLLVIDSVSGLFRDILLQVSEKFPDW